MTTTTAPSELLMLRRDDQILVQASCECGFRGTVYEGRFMVLAVAQANRHDITHGDLSSLRSER